MNSVKSIEPEKLAIAIETSKEKLNAFYPLTSFIACNALKGLEKLDFDEAILESQKYYKSTGYLPLSEYRAMYETGRINPIDFREAFERLKNQEQEKTQNTKTEPQILTWPELCDNLLGYKISESIDRTMIKWLSAFLDKSQALWSPMNKEDLFYSWRDLAFHDLSLNIEGSLDWKQDLNALPASSFETVKELLQRIGIGEESAVEYLTRHLTKLPGWTSYLKWKEVYDKKPQILTDYLAIRLFYDYHLCKAKTWAHAKNWSQLIIEWERRKSSESQEDLSQKNKKYSGVWQEAYEINYRNELLKSLSHRNRREEAKLQPFYTHIVFCIDCRSEPIRRNLEKTGLYTTYGYAGFFGFPMKFKEIGNKNTKDLCPILLSPEKTVFDITSEKSKARRVSGQSLLVSAISLRKKLKTSPLGAFGLVELTGLWSAVPLLAKTLFPNSSKRVVESIRRRILGKANSYIDDSQFSLEEKVQLAKSNIAGIGLRDLKAKMIVLCGHKSETENNPYASALDCGACGGNSGAHSARLAAKIFNSPEVRSALEAEDIEIGRNTLFVAAQHNTTNDTFEILDEHLIPGTYNAEIKRLKKDLALTGKKAREEKTKLLPRTTFRKFDDSTTRSNDWAQVAPEWGLARNAAFIVAPRELTQDIDLEGRTFLHSYDCEKDQDGAILEVIMTAPMVVAQWINSQYYFSTVDNDIFGSGSKVYHNVVGDFGVMQGDCSDLKLGLPLESVAYSNGKRFHEPMRLLVLIRSRTANIDKVLEDHTEVRNLVDNRWIRLVAMNPETGEFLQADSHKNWRPLLKEPLPSISKDSIESIAF